MPKQRITKEMVVEAAFEIARKQGMEQVTVKSIAARLACSVQPIYSYCKNMDGLKQDVAARTGVFIREYITARTDQKDLFRSIGKAHLQLAKEEPNLFKIFILHRREGISSLKDLYEMESAPNVAPFIAEQLGLKESQAKDLHLNMLIYTIGIGAIFSVTTPGIPAEEIFAKQEEAFQAFLLSASKNDT
ncbi:MAG: TetR/AcrR family transcriptional regulator [Lachnospiraceae bacterium]|nr:TetR/AcrR family transcriptional regulator [Lachnospiraceae bacterium]